MKEKTDTQHDRFARLLDDRFRIPGTNVRVGLDALLGLIPGAGDWLGAAIALYLPAKAVAEGASAPVILRMFLNILIDLLVGVIPILGDLFDVTWRANLRNAELLGNLEDDPVSTETKSSVLLWGLLVILIGLVFGVLLLIGWGVNVVLHLGS